MESDVLNSCLMLAVNLDTPVSLGCIFDEEDLKDTGIELDSHITLLPGFPLPASARREAAYALLPAGSGAVGIYRRHTPFSPLQP